MLWRHDNLQHQALLCNFLGEAHTFHCSGIMCLLEIISALIKAFYPDYDYFINYSCGLKPRWQLISKLSIPKLIVKPKASHPFSAFLLLLPPLLKKSPDRIKKIPCLLSRISAYVTIFFALIFGSIFMFLVYVPLNSGQYFWYLFKEGSAKSLGQIL